MKNVIDMLRQKFLEKEFWTKNQALKEIDKVYTQVIESELQKMKTIS